MAHMSTELDDQAALAVYLINWRQPDWCVAAVNSILASDLPVRLTVIDNSPEHQPTLASKLPAEVMIVANPSNLGYAGGGNRALSDWIAAGEEELVVIGSHDLLVKPNTLSLLIEAAGSCAEVGVLGPVLLDKASGASSSLEASRLRALPACPNLTEVEWLSGTCLMLRRSCVDVIGGFDTVYHSYSEDKDICRRAVAAGWKVGLCPDAVAQGMGTGDGDAALRAGMNAVRAELIHCGVGAALRMIGGQAATFARNVVGGVAFWRHSVQRRASRRRALAFLYSLKQVDVVWMEPNTNIG